MSDPGDIRITTIHRDAVQFALYGTGKNRQLSCLGSPSAALAVQVLKENQPLVPKSSCCWGKPSWLPIQLMIDGQNYHLLIKVKDVVKKWQKEERFVREKLEASDLDALAPRYLEYDFLTPSSTLTDTPSHTRESSSTSYQGANTPSGSLTGPSSQSQTEISVSYSQLSDPPPKAKQTQPNRFLARSQSRKSSTSSDWKDDNKQSVGVSFLESPSFSQFVQFLQLPINIDLYGLVLAELGAKWPEIQSRITSQKHLWQRKCAKHKLANLPLGDKSFPLEYFHVDDSVWLHLKLGAKRFVINLSTGELYQFNFRLISDNEAMIFRKIESIKAGVEPIRVSAFKLQEKIAYRIFNPFFTISLEQAMKRGIVTSDNRNGYYQEWRQGLKALHHAGLLHGSVTPSALLLQIDPATQRYRAVIGSFSRSAFPTDETRSSLQQQECEQLEKCFDPLFDVSL